LGYGAIIVRRIEFCRFFPFLEYNRTFLLLENPKKATLALLLGMGIKLYTAFEDGSSLITNSLPIWENPGHGMNFEKQASAGRKMDIWTFHQKRLAELEGQANGPDSLLDFNRYIRQSDQEEESFE
jgi:hypothetical protein